MRWKTLALKRSCNFSRANPNELYHVRATHALTFISSHGALPYINTLRPRQDGYHFADNIFKLIFLNEHVFIMIKISLKFVPMSPITNEPASVHKMAWCRKGLLTNIRVTWLKWVNISYHTAYRYNMFSKRHSVNHLIYTSSYLNSVYQIRDT